MLALVLALPALGAQDEKKPQSPKEQFAAMEKDFSAQQGKLIAEIRKTKGDEQQKLVTKYYDLNKEFAEKFYKLAEDNPKDPVAGDALGWVVENGFGSPHSQKAADKLLEQFPEHKAVARVCQNLARSPGGETKLKEILDKETSKPGVKAAAALALGEVTADRLDRLGQTPEADKVAAEAEKYFTQAIDLGKGNDAVKKDAERLLTAVKSLRVGKEAPDIKGADLDGKEFKLSDYRGKVVLLDFWGDW
jgi:hypothetical protein